MGNLLVTAAIQQHTSADSAGKGKQRKDVRVTGLFVQRSKEIMGETLSCSTGRAMPDARQQPLIIESERQESHAVDSGMYIYGKNAGGPGQDAYANSASETGQDVQGNIAIETGTESRITETARQAPVTEDMAVNGEAQGEQQAADTNEYGSGESRNDLLDQEREMRERRRLRRQQKKEMMERIRERRRQRKEMLENMLERRKERKVLLERTLASREYRKELIAKAHKGKEQQEQLSDIEQINQQEQRALTGEILEEQKAAIRLPAFGQPDIDALISHLRKRLSHCEGGLKKGYFKTSDVKKLRTMLNEAETRRKKYLSMESYEMEQARRNAALNTIDFHA